MPKQPLGGIGGGAAAGSSKAVALMKSYLELDFAASKWRAFAKKQK
jgi:hypothetical protein